MTPTAAEPKVSGNEIYNFLKTNSLTDKTEDVFLEEYSNPEKAKELHKFFETNKLTEKGYDDFYNQYLKKKDSELPSDTGTSNVAAGALEQPAPEASDARKYLEQNGKYFLDNGDGKLNPITKTTYDFGVKNVGKSVAKKPVSAGLVDATKKTFATSATFDSANPNSERNKEIYLNHLASQGFDVDPLRKASEEVAAGKKIIADNSVPEKRPGQTMSVISPSPTAEREYNKGTGNLLIGDNDQAIKDFQKAIALTTEDKSPVQQIIQGEVNETQFPASQNPANAMYGLGLAYFNKKDDTNAQNFFIQAIEKDPTNANAKIGLANVFQRNNNKEEAQRLIASAANDYSTQAVAMQMQADQDADEAKNARSRELMDIAEGLTALATGDPKHQLGTIGKLTPWGFALHMAQGVAGGAERMAKGAKEVVMGDDKLKGGLQMAAGAAQGVFAAIPQVEAFNTMIQPIKDLEAAYPDNAAISQLSKAVDYPFTFASSISRDVLGYKAKEDTKAALTMELLDLAVVMGGGAFAHKKITNYKKYASYVKEVAERAKNGEDVTKELEEIKNFEQAVSKLSSGELKLQAEKKGNKAVLNAIDKHDKLVEPSDEVKALDEEMLELDKAVVDEVTAPVIEKRKAELEVLRDKQIEKEHKAELKEAVKEAEAEDLLEKQKQVEAALEANKENPSVVKLLKEELKPVEKEPKSQAAAESLEATQKPLEETVTADVSFDSAKEGDTILHKGEKVTVIGKTKTRGGREVVEVSEAPKTAEQIRKQALNDLSARKNLSFEDVEKYHGGELLNLISDYTAREASRKSSYTIDKEQWNNEVEQLEKTNDNKKTAQTNTPQAESKSKNKSPKPIDEVRAKILKAEPDTIRQYIMKMFLSGKRILTKDFQDETGYGKRRAMDNKVMGLKEFQKRIWEYSNDGMSMDDMVMSVQEAWRADYGEASDQQKIRDEIISVLKDHDTKTSLANELEHDFSVNGEVIVGRDERVAKRTDADLERRYTPDNEEERIAMEAWDAMNSNQRDIVMENDQVARTFDDIMEMTEEEAGRLLEEEKEYEQFIKQSYEKNEQQSKIDAESSSARREKTAGEAKAESEYRDQLKEIEEKLADAKKAKQAKLDKLSNKIDLFAEEGKANELFGEEQDLSPENIEKQLKPETDKIVLLEKELSDFKENEEAFLRKYDDQAEIPVEEKEPGEDGGPEYARKKKKSAEPAKGNEDAVGVFNPATPRKSSTSGQFKPIEMPEMIQLLKDLLDGKVPLLKNLRDALGYFSPKIKNITLDRELFKEKNRDELLKALQHEVGHLIDYLPDDSMAKGNILGRIASLKEFLEKELPFKPGADGKLTEADIARFKEIAKETSKDTIIEKEIDEVIEKTTGVTPQQVLDIWNSTLEGRNLGELYSFIAQLSSAEKKSVVKEAMKGMVPKSLEKFLTTVKEKTGNKITIKEIIKGDWEAKLKELITEEVRKRKLWQEKEIKDELIALSKEWRPWNEMMASATEKKYRNSSKELYADAMSVLFNSPGLLEEKAPKFFEAFMNYIDNKPEFAELYHKLMEDMNNPEAMLKARLERVEESFKEGDKILQEGLEKSAQKGQMSWINKFKQAFISKNMPLMNKLIKNNKVDKKLTAYQKTINDIEKLAYTDNFVDTFMRDALLGITSRLNAVGLDKNALGVVLKADMEINFRKDMANPGGHNPVTAKELKDTLFSRYTPEQVKVLLDEVKNFHDTVFDIYKQAYEAGLYTKEQYEDIIEKNKDSYATFTPLKYAYEHLSGAIKQAKGTLEDIANPYTQTILKTANVIKWMNRNKGVLAIEKALRTNAKTADEIYDSVPMKDSNGSTVGYKKREGYSTVEYMKEGKHVAIDVKPEVAKIMESDISGYIPIVTEFNNAFKPLVTSLNLGWALYNNPIRDKMRTMRNLTAIVRSSEGNKSPLKIASVPLKFIMNDFKRLRDSKKYANGEITDFVESVLDDAGMTQHIFGDYDPHAESSIQNIYKKAGLLDNEIESRSKFKDLLKPVVAAMDAIKWIGSISETSTKLSGYETLLQYGFSPEAAGYYTRKYVGTPNFLDKGTLTPISNTALPFSNVMAQGLRADLELATGKNTASAYWTQQAITSAPSIMIGAAAIGVFGDDVKEMYDDIPEYEKTNYYVVPIGRSADGKVTFWRVPLDEIGRLFHAITYKGITYGAGEGRGASDVAKIGTGFVPSFSPVAETGTGWLQYMSGVNPYDHFYGRHVLTEDESRAGGADAAKKMFLWTGKKVGLGYAVSLLEHDAKAETWTEYAFKNTPVLSRIIKTSNKGEADFYRDIKEKLLKEKAKDKLMRAEIVENEVSKVEGYSLEKYRSVIANVQKQLFPEGIKTEEDYNRMEGTRKMIKSAMLKGINSPMSNVINALIYSQTNAEKKAIIERYKSKADEEDFKELINFLDNENVISAEIVSKFKTGK